jgi:hypothetical protein
VPELVAMQENDTTINEKEKKNWQKECNKNGQK